MAIVDPGRSCAIVYPKRMGRSRVSSVLQYDQPVDADQRCKYRIIRTPEKGPLNAIVLGHRHFGYYTHHIAKRTRPHATKDCDGCRLELPMRWYGFLGVQSTRGSEIGVLEFTPPCIDAINAYYDLHGTLRGARLQVSRLGGQKNGRVRMSLAKSTVPDSMLPPEPDVVSFLARIWDSPFLLGREKYEQVIEEIATRASSQDQVRSKRRK